MSAPRELSPSSVRHYLALAAGAFGTMLDVGLVVLGSALLGLAAAVILDGFDLVTIGLDLSTGAMLSSALVIGIVGGFALGVASEGPLGRGRRLAGYDEVEVAVARALAAVVVGLLLLLVEGLLDEPTVGLPTPFVTGVVGIGAVAMGGLLVVPVLGVPLAWWIRSGGLGAGLARDGDIPILYFVWAIATMLFI